MPKKVSKDALMKINICHSQAQMLMKSVFSFVLYGVVLSYIMKMERECRCSNGPIRDVLKYGAIVFIAVAALGLVPAFCKPLNDNMLIVSVLGISKLVYFGTLIYFIWNLKSGDCNKCSDDWRRLGLEVYVYIMLVLLLLSILYPFIVLAIYKSCACCKK